MSSNLQNLSQSDEGEDQDPHSATSSSLSQQHSVSSGDNDPKAIPDISRSNEGEERAKKTAYEESPELTSTVCSSSELDLPSSHDATPNVPDSPTIDLSSEDEPFKRDFKSNHKTSPSPKKSREPSERGDSSEYWRSQQRLFAYPSPQSSIKGNAEPGPGLFSSSESSFERRENDDDSGEESDVGHYKRKRRKLPRSLPSFCIAICCRGVAIASWVAHRLVWPIG